MGGGGKGAKSSKAKMAGPVADISGRLAGRGKQLFDIGLPTLQTGQAHTKELISTGGVGARVPLISQATRAQQRGSAQAVQAVAQGMNRGGVPKALQSGILEPSMIRGQQRARNVGVAAALPLIYQATGASSKAPTMGMQALGAGLGVLASGLKAPTASGKPGGGDVASGMGSLGSQGMLPGMGGGGKGGGGKAGGGGSPGFTGGNMIGSVMTP
jgi:hypothetical protein